jgi:hypothetical membrane protein
LTVGAIAVLFIGLEWYPENLRAFVASVVVFYVLLYIAGGRRLSRKIRFRDYLAYVLISLGVVRVALVIALCEAHKRR